MRTVKLCVPGGTTYIHHAAFYLLISLLRFSSFLLSKVNTLTYPKNLLHSYLLTCTSIRSFVSSSFFFILVVFLFAKVSDILPC